MDAGKNEDGQTLKKLYFEKCCNHQPPVASHEMTLGEEMSDNVTSQMTTSQIMSLNDVIFGLTQTSIKGDYTEFTDFPSSEDVEAFLADMELGCENVPMRKSLSPTTTMGSDEAFCSKLYHKAEEPRTLKSNEYSVENISDMDHTKQSKNISNLNKLYEDNVDKEEAICDIKLSSDCFCALEDYVWSPCSDKITSNSDKMIHDIESSDSQFLQDCESVFIEFTKDVCNKKDRKENSERIPSPAHSHNDLVLKSQQRSTYCREDSTKQRKNFCRSVFTDELHEEHILCNMSLKHEEMNVIRSCDRDTNETKIQQGPQITRNGWTAVNHHEHKEASGDEMSNNSFEMMASSPDLFSQSLSCVEEVCYETPNLFSSPKLISGESRRSRCTKHLITTPDLFSYSRSPCSRTHSCSRQGMNSVSLFSCSDHSHLSSSSPLSSLARSASLPISNENEADTQLIIKHREVENKFVRNSQTVSFHSTPYNVNLSSKRLHKMWTPAGVSPLLSDFRGTSPCNEDISVQGSPILFSPMSSSSL